MQIASSYTLVLMYIANSYSIPPLSMPSDKSSNCSDRALIIGPAFNQSNASLRARPVANLQVRLELKVRRKRTRLWLCKSTGVCNLEF